MFRLRITFCVIAGLAQGLALPGFNAAYAQQAAAKQPKAEVRAEQPSPWLEQLLKLVIKTEQKRFGLEPGQTPTLFDRARYSYEQMAPGTLDDIKTDWQVDGECISKEAPDNRVPATLHLEVSVAHGQKEVRALITQRMERTAKTLDNLYEERTQLKKRLAPYAPLASKLPARVPLQNLLDTSTLQGFAQYLERWEVNEEEAKRRLFWVKLEHEGNQLISASVKQVCMELEHCSGRKNLAEGRTFGSDILYCRFFTQQGKSR